MLDAYRARPGAVAVVLVAFLGLNLADLLLTVRALDRGATEANPVIGLLFSVDPVVAGAFKLTITLAVAVTIWKMRRYRLMLETSLVVVAGLTVVLAYHILGAALLAG